MNDKMGKMLKAFSKARVDIFPTQKSAKMLQAMESHRMAQEWANKLDVNTTLYSRVFEIYGDFFEKLADGIKVKLLQDEIFAELDVDIIYDFSEEKIIEIVFEFLSAKRESIIAKYNQFYKSDASVVKIAKQADQKVSETLFDHFDKKGKSLAEYIQKTHLDAKPKDIACIIYTLVKFNVLSVEFLDRKTTLHNLVQSTFNIPGSRQALTKSLNDLNSAHSKERVKLAKFEKEFESYL